MRTGASGVSCSVTWVGGGLLRGASVGYAAAGGGAGGPGAGARGIDAEGRAGGGGAGSGGVDGASPGRGNPTVLVGGARGSTGATGASWATAFAAMSTPRAAPAMTTNARLCVLPDKPITIHHPRTPRYDASPPGRRISVAVHLPNRLVNPVCPVCVGRAGAPLDAVSEPLAWISMAVRVSIFVASGLAQPAL